MKTFCHLIGKYFGIIAVVFLILGMTVPDSFKWVVGNIGGIPVLSTLLGVIMFGMGTTLNLRDFALVLKRPVDVFVGVCAQYLIMPSLAFLLAMAFNLDPASNCWRSFSWNLPWRHFLQRHYLHVQRRLGRYL